MAEGNVVDLLGAEAVVLVVDTNLLVEFQSLDRLPWTDLVPNARSIRIVVPTTVAEEMDAHKKKAGKLRRRGLEFNRIVKAIEASQDETAVLNAAVRTTVEFGPLYRRSELDGDLFDLEDPDGRIVAEFSLLRQEIPSAVLITDDSKPLRWARKMGLPHSRPPESWRLVEGPDEKDAKIAELERRIGARSRLEISFPDALERAGRSALFFEPAPLRICGECIAKLVGIATGIDRKVSRGELESRYPSAMRGALSLNGFALGGVTAMDLDRYEQEYGDFVLRVQGWAKMLPDLMSIRGIMLPSSVSVSNVGELTADRVYVEARLSGDFHFAPLTILDDFLEDILRLPRVPRDISSSVMDQVSFERPASPRADEFRALDEGDLSKACQRISWRAEEARQGATARLPMMIVSNHPDASGLLTVVARGAGDAVETSSSVPLRAMMPKDDPSIFEYLDARPELLPEKYRSAMAMHLKSRPDGCAC